MEEHAGIQYNIVNNKSLSYEDIIALNKQLIAIEIKIDKI